METGRRSILNWFLGTSLGALVVAVLYPVLRYLPPPRLPEASAADLDAGRTNDPGFVDKGFKIVRFGTEPVIIIRVAEDDYRAFSATCTHLACIVEFRKERQVIWCNCHDGRYDLQGQVVGGPPPRPLRRYTVNLTPSDVPGVQQVIVSEA